MPNEESRWLKVQEQIMNLVTAERTDQQELSVMKTQVGKLIDHVEDLDDYLRGVAGEESLDNRVVLLERESTANHVLLRQIKRQLEDLKDIVSGMQIQSAISQGTDAKQRNWFMAKLTFWGPIIIASLGLIVPLTKIACDQFSFDQAVYRPDDRLRRQIERDKKSQRARDVQKKVREIEDVQRVTR